MAPTDSLECVVVFEPSGNVCDLLSNAFFGGEKFDQTRSIHAAHHHHFQSPGGGARVRLTQHSAFLLGISEENGNRLAAAVECLHNASLVQDDLQDKSLFRRGRESVAAKFGSDVALGFADRLITSAFVCLSEVSPPAALPGMIHRVHRAVAETVDGQTSELSAGRNGCSWDSRLVAAKGKSGPLFALALELPLILARQQEHLPTAHEAACLFGLGYQILDDLTDQVADAGCSSHGNLVLTMETDPMGDSAQATAARLARGFLHDAIVGAERLPRGAGGPLIKLADQLLSQLGAFDS